MVKNTIGGKHHKKQKNKVAPEDAVRNFPWPDSEMTFLGRVTQMFGGNIIEVKIENVEFKCRIPGSFRKRVWIGKGDVVLVHRDTTCDVSEVIFVYKPEEIQVLKASGYMVSGDDDDDVEFQTNEEIDISTI